MRVHRWRGWGGLTCLGSTEDFPEEVIFEGQRKLIGQCGNSEEGKRKKDSSK